MRSPAVAPCMPGGVWDTDSKNWGFAVTPVNVEVITSRFSFAVLTFRLCSQWERASSFLLTDAPF